MVSETAGMSKTTKVCEQCELLETTTEQEYYYQIVITYTILRQPSFDSEFI